MQLLSVKHYQVFLFIICYYVCLKKFQVCQKIILFCFGMGKSSYKPLRGERYLCTSTWYLEMSTSLTSLIPVATTRWYEALWNSNSQLKGVAWWSLLSEQPSSKYTMGPKSSSWNSRTDSHRWKSLIPLTRKPMMWWRPYAKCEAKVFRLLGGTGNPSSLLKPWISCDWDVKCCLTKRHHRNPWPSPDG